MPEGDVVLRVARRLDAALAGQVLTRGELRWPTLGGVDLTGAVVVGHGTHGKHLLTRLDDGRTLHTHLRMDGLWRVHPTADLAAGTSRADRSPRVRAVLGTTRWTCLGIDLGMMDLVATAEEDRLLGHLGPDVLAPDLDAAAAAARILGQGERGIGEVLLDQTVVAGLGTIYMAESLWAQRVSPWAPAGALGPTAVDLVTTARRLMLRSAAARVPTATGDARRSTNVHGRERRSCPRCGTPIRRAEVGRPPTARRVYWCPRCQPGEPVATRT
ncbi:Fpg/Nei family DNA glycosylase [Georgenia yuyongxinii]